MNRKTRKPTPRTIRRQLRDIKVKLRSHDSLAQKALHAMTFCPDRCDLFASISLGAFLGSIASKPDKIRLFLDDDDAQVQVVMACLKLGRIAAGIRLADAVE